MTVSSLRQFAFMQAVRLLELGAIGGFGPKDTENGVFSAAERIVAFLGDDAVHVGGAPVVGQEVGLPPVADDAAADWAEMSDQRKAEVEAFRERNKGPRADTPALDPTVVDAAWRNSRKADVATDAASGPGVGRTDFDWIAPTPDEIEEFRRLSPAQRVEKINGLLGLLRILREAGGVGNQGTYIVMIGGHPVCIEGDRIPVDVLDVIVPGIAQFRSGK
ncbi:hypothetical protein HLH33_13040 [Gluconacetobacter diazotrophicus]|uniref:Uncharacterized protein n=1 Tax=Gluconacetobacter diazotrophicus TaxID=33996 RepID=A0A7W4I6L3_GLUDI|nr:hypothetical protein [Gluconacetobacter diazotrophicus]MBB2157225.1 hypothetical protein [Gluconacetobacter diazotrophicus]